MVEVTEKYLEELVKNKQDYTQLKMDFIDVKMEYFDLKENYDELEDRFINAIVKLNEQHHKQLELLRQA